MMCYLSSIFRLDMTGLGLQFPNDLRIMTHESSSNFYTSMLSFQIPTSTVKVFTFHVVHDRQIPFETSPDL